MGTRAIKGQDIEVSVLADGVTQNVLTMQKDFNVNFKTKIIEEGYLGRTTQDYDTIYDGVGGDIGFNFAKPGVFKFVEMVVSKARAREPGVVVNIRATFNFPQGGRARVVFRDVQFGELGMGFGGRGERGTLKTPWSCSEFQVLPG
jgi:hypothetical protein